MHTKAPMVRRYSASRNVILRDSICIAMITRPFDDKMNVSISEAERDAFTARIVNLLNADQHAESPQQWLGGDGSTALEKQAQNWRELMQSVMDQMAFGTGVVEVRCGDPREPLPPRLGQDATAEFKINALAAALDDAIDVASQGYLDPGTLPKWQAALKLARYSKISRDTLEEMCRQRHGWRVQQGKQFGLWSEQSDEFQQLQRDAMKYALSVLWITVD